MSTEQAFAGISNSHGRDGCDVNFKIRRCLFLFPLLSQLHADLNVAAGYCFFIYSFGRLSHTTASLSFSFAIYLQLFWHWRNRFVSSTQTEICSDAVSLCMPRHNLCSFLAIVSVSVLMSELFSMKRQGHQFCVEGPQGPVAYSSQIAPNVSNLRRSVTNSPSACCNTVSA